MIIDFHVHVWDQSWITEAHKWGLARQAAHRRLPFRDPAAIRPRVGQNHMDPGGEDLLAYMDRDGIDAAVLMPVDWGLATKEDAEASIEDINRAQIGLGAKYPGRVYSFCGIDPRRPNAVEFFRFAVTELGAKGLKLYPPCGFYPDDPTLCYSLYEAADELGVPVLLHVAPGAREVKSKYAHPIYVDSAATDFPGVWFIMSHAGFGHGNSGWYEECLAFSAAKSNLMLDLGAWDAFGALKEEEYFVRQMDRMRDAIGAHRIIWSSDYNKGRIVKPWIEAFQNLPEKAPKYGFSFSQDEIELMFSGNAKRLLKL
jgi:predicted TIM-barrel fold metal-dependent hydrolase